MNFQLPQEDDDFDYYENSSQDESRNSQGRHALFIYLFFGFHRLFTHLGCTCFICCIAEGWILEN